MIKEIIGDATLYLGDCIHVLNEMEPGPYVTLTDPPYGIGWNYEEYQDSEENLVELIGNFMPQVLKISNRVALTCGVLNIWKYPSPEWVLAWVVPGGVGRSKWGFICWQPILVYGRDPYLQNNLGCRPDIILKTESAPKIDHPCPKPLGVWKILANRISVDAEEIFLDPFMGSGTTGIIAAEMGRKFIGIEIDSKYFDLACKRIDAAERQGRMF